MIAVMHILLKGTITITGEGKDEVARRTDERNIEVIFKIYCMSEIKRPK